MLASTLTAYRVLSLLNRNRLTRSLHTQIRKSSSRWDAAAEQRLRRLTQQQHIASAGRTVKYRLGDLPGSRSYYGHPEPDRPPTPAANVGRRPAKRRNTRVVPELLRPMAFLGTDGHMRGLNARHNKSDDWEYPIAVEKHNIKYNALYKTSSDAPKAQNVFPNVANMVIRLNDVQKQFTEDQEQRIAARVHRILHREQFDRWWRMTPEEILAAAERGSKDMRVRRKPFEPKDDYFPDVWAYAEPRFDMPELFRQRLGTRCDGNVMKCMTCIEINLRDWRAEDLEVLLSALRQSRSVFSVQIRMLHGDKMEAWARGDPSVSSNWWHTIAGMRILPFKGESNHNDHQLALDTYCNL